MARKDAKAWRGMSLREIREEGRGRKTCTRGGMIKTHCTRQTAITNSTPPVGDNYRAGRERGYTRAGGARRCLPRIKVAENPDRL